MGMPVKKCVSILLTNLFIVTISLVIPAKSHAAIQCYDCHGSRSDRDSRPVDSPVNDPTRNVNTGAFAGSHRTHMTAPGSAEACAKCHSGSEEYTSSHRDGVIRVSGNINGSASVATYNNFSGFFPQTPNPVLHSCTNVNCHF